MTCRTVQERLAAALVDELAPRERLEAEAHAAHCARCADEYRDLAATAVAVDRAYAPLRSRSVALSPARVRLAVRAPRSRVTRLAPILAKANEMAVAAAVMAFAVIGSLPAPSTTADPAASAPLEGVLAVDDNIIPVGFVEPPREQASVTRNIGRFLLHDTLLDARVVPVGEGWHAYVPKSTQPGQPY